MRWRLISLVRSLSPNIISAELLHRGQWAPQPSPEPEARTNAPYMTTRTMYPTVPQTHRAKPSMLGVGPPGLPEPLEPSWEVELKAEPSASFWHAAGVRDPT